MKTNKNKIIHKTPKEQGLLNVLSEAIKSSDEIATGALGTEKLHLFMIPGRLIQAVRNKTFTIQLASEFEELRERGKIKSNIEENEDFNSSLQELMTALEQPPVDQLKFNLLKSIFIKFCSADESEIKVSPSILMNIVKNLSSSEILVLSAINKIRLNLTERDKKIHSSREWLQRVAEELNFSGPSMVEHYEESLVDKKIITPRTYSDKSGIIKDINFRLTDLGLSICHFLSEDNI